MNVMYSVNLRHIALYPKDCLCEVSAETGREAFSIISLFMNGIRLKSDAPGAMDAFCPGQTVLANIRLPINGLESGGFPCRVRQVGEREVFLAFGAPLDIPFLAAMRDHPRIFA